MSDLIDRQALLKQIDIDSDGEPGYYGDTWKFIDTIKSMPHTELSTNLAEVGTDLISRQAAIDAVEHEENIIAAMDSVNDSELKRIKRAVMRILSALPSAQPEIVTCDKCVSPKRSECIWHNAGATYCSFGEVTE